MFVRYNSINSYKKIFNKYSDNITSIEFKISFISNGIVLETQNKYNGSVITDLPIPNENGYTFEGWYSNTTFEGVPYQNGALWESEVNLFLYAKWSANKYNVILNSNDGILIGENVFEVTFDESFSIETIAEREGYTFEGWYDINDVKYITNNGEGTVLWDKFEDTVLYAHWAIEKYEIKINDNGTIVWLGPSGLSSTSCTIEYGTVLASINLIYTFKNSSYGYKEGKIFDHFEYKNSIVQWNNVPDLGADGDVVIITPVWIFENHTIYFNPKCDMNVVEIIANYDTSITLPIISRTGYTFGGWYNPSNGEKISWQTMPDLTPNVQNNGSVQLEAKWDKCIYSVEYNKNGGEGTMEPSEHTYGVSKRLSENTFYRTGYTFIGWSTYKNGAIMYSDGESVINLTDSKSITLYAIWKANTYTITYKNLLKSIYAPNITSYTYGQTISLPISLDYSDGYTISEFSWFEGWYEDANFTKQITQISANRTGNIELYAKYNYKQYLYSSTLGWTITDDGTTKILIADSETLRRKISEINGAFDKVTITLSLIMREKNDGYQEIKLYATLSSGLQNVIINETAYEYGGVGKNSNYSTVNFTKTNVSMNTLSTYNEIYLELGADGFGNDDWEISYIYVTLNYHYN